MARRMAIGWAVAASLWCSQVLALGLGEITVHSALNQKLDAQIELLQVRGLQESEILAQLASSEDFKRVGVERFFYLTGLRFQVEVTPQGGAILHITSETPITEPYLNFLVQVMWPNGRLLKEYTVLLDPPTYKDQAAPAVASPGRSDPGGGPAGRVERTPTRPDSQVSLSSAPRSTQSTSPSQPPQDRLSGDSYGVTDRDDTLWAIAQRTKPSGAISVQQNMLAIVRLNPEAFIGGNINLLKAGYTLRLPGESDAAAVSQGEAIAQVADQNAAWQAYRRGEALAGSAPAGGSDGAAAGSSTAARQVDATTNAAETGAVAGVDGELRIVAADAADRGTGTGGGEADIAVLEGELAATQDEAERLSRERDEAMTRLDSLAGNVEQAQRQIEVRDQQIAQLQAQVKSMQEAAGAATPTSQSEAAKSEGGISGLLSSPMVQIGAAIVVVLIVVAGLMRARTRKAAEKDDLARYDLPSTGRVVVPAAAAAAFEDEDDDALVTEAAEEPPDLSDEDHDASAQGAQTSDVIGEADIYIAYGRYPQAVNLLQGALEDAPDRSDVRLKLLEVYAETKAEAGFAAQMEELLARCDDDDILLEARELEAKLREDGADTTVSTPAQPADADDFELDLDDDKTVVRGSSVAATPELDTTDDASDDLGGDLGLDFNPDDNATSIRRTSPDGLDSDTDDADLAVAADEDEFDLEDLEYDPPEARQSQSVPETAAESTESDDAFDFLNEEDAATTKLDLARAYIDMGDAEGAREILGEVLQEGSSEQQKTANELLGKLG